MKLSTAIALGRHLIQEPSGWTYRKCAIGMGLAAIGEHFHEMTFRRDWLKLIGYFVKTGPPDRAIQEWPWLENRVKTMDGKGYISALSAIGLAFFDVTGGLITLDQLIVWVASIEPAEEVCQERTYEVREEEWISQ
jgi:hypothetical protein